MSKTTWKRTYYYNGELSCETPFQNGKRNGVEKIYDGYGNIYYKNIYQDDKVHGVQKVYLTSGSLHYEVYYIQGEKATKEEWERHELITQLAEIDE